MTTRQTDAAARPSVRGLLPLLRVPNLRRLVIVRLVNSFGDGAFQGALVSAVLFNPERQTTAIAIAGGFAVLLLPYSIVGPFAGALLDRWSRRQVIVWATLLRCALVAAVAVLIAAHLPMALLFTGALLVTGAARFVGSGLSAALPHTVAADSLVGANALATTTGSIATALGGGYAIGMRDLIGGADEPIALVTATVIVFYAVTALIASRFGRMALGPDRTDEPAETFRAVLDGLAGGVHHAIARPTVGLAISLVMLVRFCFGLCTLLVLMLYQHYFTQSDGMLLTGLNGVAEVLGAVSIGLFLGAVVTAPMVRLLGRTTYLAGLMVLATLAVLLLGPRFTMLSLMIAAPVLAFTYQATKVCVDAIVQADSDDAFVGRVFALYDTLNNLMYVGAFALGAAVIPADGRSLGLLVLMAVVYALAGAGYVLAMRRVHRVGGHAVPPP